MHKQPRNVPKLIVQVNMVLFICGLFVCSLFLSNMFELSIAMFVVLTVQCGLLCFLGIASLAMLVLLRKQRDVMKEVSRGVWLSLAVILLVGTPSCFGVAHFYPPKLYETKVSPIQN